MSLACSSSFFRCCTMFFLTPSSMLRLFCTNRPVMMLMLMLIMQAMMPQNRKPGTDTRSGSSGIMVQYRPMVVRACYNVIGLQLSHIVMDKTNLQEFPFQDYDTSSLVLLGQGSYGRVYKSKHAKTGTPVAIKQVSMAKIRDQNLVDALHKEIQILQQLRSPHTVQLIQHHTGPNYTYMVMELCDSDLRRKMSDRRLTQQECIDLFCEILVGVRVLVEKSCIHRDLKPENILLKEGRIKIGDFGFAKKADLYGYEKYTDICGTPLYMSPQLLNEEPYTAKCDIWSLGLILFELVYGSTPWPAKTIETYSNAIRKRPLAFPFNVTTGKETRDFIRRALVIEESQRIGWEEVFAHPLIKNRIPGDVVISRHVEPKVRLILVKMQSEANRKFIDQVNIFKNYESTKVLDHRAFQKLLKQLNPSITSYEVSVIFDACDRNSDNLIQRSQFQQIFCSVHYHFDYEVSRIIDDLLCIIQQRKINLADLFSKFDHNKSGALDSQQFEPPSFPRQQVRTLYKHIDADKTGLVQKNQFLRAVASELTLHRNYTAVWMERADRNAKMLKIHLDSLNLHTAAVMKMADLDLDKHISQAEFAALMQKIKFVIGQEEIEEVFQLVDTNSSEQISMAELGSYII